MLLLLLLLFTDGGFYDVAVIWVVREKYVLLGVAGAFWRLLRCCATLLFLGPGSW